MYNQAYNRAQLIPMTIRVNEVINEDRLEKYGTNEELDAYCNVEYDWGSAVKNERGTEWSQYNFEDPKASMHVEEVILEHYGKIKEQEVVLAYVCSRLKSEQTKKALATFEGYFAKKGVKFI